MHFDGDFGVQDENVALVYETIDSPRVILIRFSFNLSTDDAVHTS